MDGSITGSKKAITFVVMMAALMALIDITIVNVALNDIRASFATPTGAILPGRLCCSPRQARYVAALGT